MTDDTVSIDVDAPPSGFATFLFTDIEGSTRRWVDESDEMHDALARHDRALREQIESHRGHVVKFTGDGAMAVFRNPDDAVAAAIAAQIAIELPVRMGVHCGNAVARDGDYFGLCVNRAARLMGVAHGGQIVVSQDVAPLVGPIELVDLGMHRLKDMPASETVYQVVHADLRREFPPLAGSVGPSHNLVKPLSAFLGRAGDVDDCRAQLGRSRVVSIVGAGGLGKTRLATEVAWSVIDDFCDGVHLVELAPVSDGAEIADVIRRAIGLRGEAGRSDIDEVLDFYRNRRALLLLDNCDHLVEPARSLVERLLAGAPELHVLVTSRSALRIDGEHVIRPDPIGLEDAVELFVQRATSAHPSFAVSADERAAIEEICDTLDRLPLAIELAAAQTVALPASTIRDRLGSALDMASRHADQRHRTLRDTVAWSVALLGDDERKLFARLAVLRGSAPLMAIEKIATDGDDEETAGFGSATASLATLVEMSLVEVSRDRRRYRMLEPIRQHAEEVLTASADQEVARDRHAAWICEYVGQLATEVMDSRLQIDPGDLANIRAAARHLIDSERFADVLQLIIQGHQLWIAVHLVDDLGGWLFAALESDADLPLDLRVQAIAHVAGVWGNNAPGPRAIDLARLAVDLADSGEVSVESRFLAVHHLADAYLHFDAGSADTKEWCERALDHTNENPLFEMYAHSRIAIASFLGGWTEDGLRSADRNAELTDAFGPEAFIQLGHGFRAPMRAYLGDEVGARADLAIMHDVSPSMSPAWQATIHSTGATAWERLGDEDEMVRHLIPGLRFGIDEIGEVIAVTMSAVAILARRLPPELVAFAIGSLDNYHSMRQPRFVEYRSRARERVIAEIGDDAFESYREAGSAVALDEVRHLMRRSLLGLDWSFSAEPQA